MSELFEDIDDDIAIVGVRRDDGTATLEEGDRSGVSKTNLKKQLGELYWERGNVTQFKRGGSRAWHRNDDYEDEYGEWEGVLWEENTKNNEERGYEETSAKKRMTMIW